MNRRIIDERFDVDEEQMLNDPTSDYRRREYTPPPRKLGRYEGREVVIVERNGNLIYIRDQITGEGQWVCPFELEK